MGRAACGGSRPGTQFALATKTESQPLIKAETRILNPLGVGREAISAQTRMPRARLAAGKTATDSDEIP
jgi:hypothetical protein